MKKFTIIFTVLFVISITAKAQWVQTNGTAGKKVTSFSYIGSNIFAGTYDGVLLSTNGGDDWSATGMSADVNALTACGNYLFAGNVSDMLSVSSNNGVNWAASNNGITAGSNIVALTTSDSNIFAGASNGVYLSHDTGANWTPKNTGLTNTNVTSILAYSPYISAGTNGGGVFASSDNASTWTANNTGLTNLNVRSLGFTSAFTLFAGTSGGVFLFNSGNFTWAAVNSGLTNLNVNTLIGSGTDVFAGTTNGGLFKTTNNGTNWYAVNGNLPVNDIISLFVANGYLLVGTTSEGIWKCSLTSLTGINETDGNSNITVSPNPASDYISLGINTKEYSGLTINIYNAVGSLVTTELLKEKQQQINIRDLSNGFYVVEIKSKQWSGKQKLIIQR